MIEHAEYKKMVGTVLPLVPEGKLEMFFIK
jgi:hypothetical protein